MRGLLLGALCAAAWMFSASWRACALGKPGGVDGGGGLPAVVSGGEDKEIKQWDSNGKLVATIGSHDDAVNALAFVPGNSGEILASVGADGALKIWNIHDATHLVSSMDAHQGGAFTVAIAPDGGTIATGGADRHIRLWDRATGQKLADMPAHRGAVRALLFTADGSQIISGSADKMIRIWAVQPNLIQYQSNIIAHDETITAMALSPDGKQIASVSEDGYLKTWRLGGGGLVDRIHVGTPTYAVAYSPDGSQIATGGTDGKIRIWSAASELSVPFTGSHDRTVYALAWTLDGKTLVSGGADNKLRYWNMTNGRQIAAIAAHDGAVRAIAIVP